MNKFYEIVLLPYKIEGNVTVFDYDSRLPPYDELGNIVLEGIKDITGDSKADPLFDWPSDKGKIVNKISMPPIKPSNNPIKKSIMFATQITGRL